MGAVLDVVESILKDAAGPLHNAEITKRVLTSGVWRTHGKTPGKTINAQLAVDIKKRGKDSRFMRAGPGTFVLRSLIEPSAGDPPQIMKKSAGRFAKLKVGGHLSFTDAAEHVLKEHGGKSRCIIATSPRKRCPSDSSKRWAKLRRRHYTHK